MAKFNVKDLLTKIEGIHSGADVDKEITDKVAAAVKDAMASVTPANVSDLQSQLDDANSALQAVVDKLTETTDHTEKSSAALAIAQNAVTPDPETGDAAGAQNQA